MKQQGRFNPQFDEYQEGASDFAKPIMAHLRKLVHKQCAEVVEEIKWGIPHFRADGDPQHATMSARARVYALPFVESDAT